MTKIEFTSAGCSGAVMQVDANIFDYSDIVRMARAAKEHGFVLPIINAKSLTPVQIRNLGEQAPGHVIFPDAKVDTF
jgi:hypothetical protein